MFYPEFYLYKFFNPPKFKPHVAVKIPKASKSYELKFEKNSFFTKANKLDGNYFSCNQSEVECEILLSPENLFLAYQKKDAPKKDSTDQYIWHAFSRTLPFETHRESILNINHTHKIDFFQKKNTQDFGFLDINKVSYDEDKSNVTLTTTPFDFESDKKVNERFKKYEYDMALFALMSKVFIIGFFFHIGISKLLSIGLNEMATTFMSSHLTKNIPIFNEDEISTTLALIGSVNECLKRPNRNVTTLCLLATTIISKTSDLKINMIKSALVSSVIYSYCSKRAMLEDKKFLFFTKKEFEKTILYDAKRFLS